MLHLQDPWGIQKSYCVSLSSQKKKKKKKTAPQTTENGGNSIRVSKAPGKIRCILHQAQCCLRRSFSPVIFRLMDSPNMNVCMYPSLSTNYIVREIMCCGSRSFSLWKLGSESKPKTLLEQEKRFEYQTPKALSNTKEAATINHFGASQIAYIYTALAGATALVGAALTARLVGANLRATAVTRR